MIRMISIFGLKPGCDPDEAYRLWKEKHTQFAKEVYLPELRKYTIHRVVETFTDTEGFGKGEPYGVAQFLFDDLESARRAVNRMVTRSSEQLDEFANEYVLNPRRMLVEEEEVELSGPK